MFVEVTVKKPVGCFLGNVPDLVNTAYLIGCCDMILT